MIKRINDYVSVEENYRKIMFWMVTSIMTMIIGFIVEWNVDEALEESTQFDSPEQKIETIKHPEEAERILKHIEDHLHEN